MGWWSSSRRLGHIVAVVVRHGLAHALGRRLARWPRLARRVAGEPLPGPERLRRVFEDLGGTFIKFGQMLALQPDILSLEYCNALFNLMDRIAPFPYAEVVRRFVEDFGRPPEEVFDAFDPRPVATASVGQVHVASLGGRKLAVKVQRPNVNAEFGGDIQLMTSTARLIKWLRWRALYWMIEPMMEFVAWTREELDYRNEARYLERLRGNTRRNAREYVPAVLWDYTTTRILTVEFLEGVTVLDYLRGRDAGDRRLLVRLQAWGFDPNEFARNVIDNFLGDTFRYGLFHADLHPANLMILPGNVVGYVDFGICGALSNYSRRLLVSMTLAYSRGDLQGMSAAFFKVSMIEPYSDLEGFRRGLRDLAETWYAGRGKDQRLLKNFTQVMLEMLTLSRRTRVLPDRDVIKYIRSAIALDGLITRFAPALDIGRHLQAVCGRYIKWHARRALLSYETLVSWWDAGGRLSRDGALRLAAFLHHAAAEGLSARAEARDPAQGGAGRLRVVRLAAVIFVLALLLTLTREPVRWGVNLFTAQVALLAAAGVLFLRATRRFA
jgi:ubiquinone biosynthesis protein